MASSRAEQETGFVFDNEERTLHAWTADVRVAERWCRGGFPVVVLGKTSEGEERTWSVDLPWPGRKRPWLSLFSVAVPHYEGTGAVGSGAAAETEAPGDDLDNQGED